MTVVAKRCEDFVCCAATTIVRRAAYEKLKHQGSRSASMYIFLDKFVTLVQDVVPRSAVERIIPYDLIRSAYISAHEAAPTNVDEESVVGAFSQGEISSGRRDIDPLRDSMMDDPLRDSMLVNNYVEQ
eukprot:COSAG05_NODE_68_length_22188_cov_8.265019_3_plen_128_part_00